ncbi:outer membrane beta-barrel protein [Mucilaginibacter gotjawali]|uniref:Uncharacterized protein n=2 Tax=Mucilaginibacter gotjawali TaxID=1550579 RepID=A0A0X8X3S5_9SPHI|nr:outer membrane beta-barrel protein [Mucilaginibacter gotjawali]MBB3056393.1 opacity protein-like surface antigen [Mucilaginibacter gotjawali]BAU55100.1 hypothetical protein MgSA37_03281 [Mucilaginibacter gotjawali]
MKKHLTILSAILISLFSLNVKAQDDKPVAKSYLTFMGGTSIPLGSFASTNYSDNKSGFAKKGPTFGLDAAVYVYKSLAIGATFSFQDQGELSQADAQNLANGYNASFTKNQSSVTTVNRYHNLNLMAGPQYSFLYKNFTLDLRADAGLIKSSSTPSIIIVFNNSSNSGSTYNQLSSGATAFAYGGSAGLRYALSDSWDVGIRTNYVTSSGLKIENTGGDTGTVGRFQTKLPISEIQTTIGMTLKF